MTTNTRGAARLTTLAGLALSIWVGAAHAGDDDWDASYITHIGRSSVPVVVRHFDFGPGNLDGGHVDFGKEADEGPGRYVHIMQDYLDENLLPQYNSTGSLLSTPWLDGDGWSVIDPRSYIATPTGGSSGETSTASGGAITSGTSFASLFRSTPGLNQESIHTVGFGRQNDGNYLYEGTLDDLTGVPDYDYTAVMEFGFVHEHDQDAFITVESDGEYWMFVDGRLVMDAGWGAATTMFTGGIATEGGIKMRQDAQIGTQPGAESGVSTNSTSPGAVDNKQTTYIDADVSVGPGGNPDDVIGDDSHVGGDIGVLPTEVPMPTIVIPDLGASSGSYQPSNGATIFGDRHYSSFSMKKNTTLQILGDTRMVVDGSFDLAQGAVITVSPGATFELWVGGSIDMKHDTALNANTADPDNCFIYVTGGGSIDLKHRSVIYAHMFAPGSTLTMHQDAQASGTFVGAELDMYQGTRFTIMDLPEDFDIGMGGAQAPTMMAQRIELNRLDGLDSRRPYRVNLFYANRVSQPSVLRVHTNVRTMNLLQYPRHARVD